MSKRITDYLDDSAKKFTDKIAFVDGEESISFGELRRHSLQLAYVISKKASIREKNMVIYMDEGIESIVSIFGTSYSNNSFCFLSRNYPINYCKEIISLLEPECIITNRDYDSEVIEIGADYRIIYYEDLAYEENEFDDVEKSFCDISCDEPLCIVFTSGSTGKPKGVQISSKAMIGKVHLFELVLGNVCSDDIFANQFSFSAVSAFPVLFLSVKEGVTNHLLIKKSGLEAARLTTIISEKRITVLFCVTTIMNLVAGYDAFFSKGCMRLRTVFFAGEAISSKTINRWQEEYPNVEYINGYGTTETVGACVFNKIVHHIYDPVCNVPIGKTYDTYEYKLFDGGINEISEGNTGEIYILGDCLASCYYKDSFMTEKSFGVIRNKKRTTRYYRTGDLGRINSNHELEYIGRKDHQVKVSGYRVDLDGIEARIMCMDGVLECCCVYDDNYNRIVLFFVGCVDSSKLLDEIRSVLPTYMVPKKIIQIEKMPYSETGKINRHILLKLQKNKRNV